MQSDIYLKLVLTVIGVCLLINTVQSLRPINEAKAAEGPTHCTGRITADMYGKTPNMRSGYDVDVTCQ